MSAQIYERKQTRHNLYEHLAFIYSTFLVTFMHGLPCNKVIYQQLVILFWKTFRQDATSFRFILPIAKTYIVLHLLVVGKARLLQNKPNYNN